MFQFSVLGSGSAGNSTLVRSAGAAVLVDAGLSARQLDLRMASLELDGLELQGILLTHEHGDHTRGLDVFLRNRKVPVYCSVRTAEVLRKGIRSEVEWRLFESGDRFRIGDLDVQSFYVPHDAVEPMGYVIRRADAAFGVVSDIGHATTLVQEQLRGVDSLYLEANYDEAMLQNDTKRPWSTKQRISSRHGHLSNAQAAELVEAIAGPRLHQVVLGHLSRDCNHPDVARKVVEDRLKGLGLSTVEVLCAGQDEVLGLRSVGKGTPALPGRPGVPAPPRLPSGRNSVREPESGWTATQESLFEF